MSNRTIKATEKTSKNLVLSQKLSAPEHESLHVPLQQEFWHHWSLSGSHSSWLHRLLTAWPLPGFELQSVGSSVHEVSQTPEEQHEYWQNCSRSVSQVCPLQRLSIERVDQYGCVWH